VFKRHFDSGGTILDFDTERLKKLYKEKFEKGKKVAQEWQAEEKAAKEEGNSTADPVPETVVKAAKDAVAQASTTNNDVLSQLKELGQLKEQGVLSEEEFADLKRKLIDGM
jgi:hypothetical protein